MLQLSLEEFERQSGIGTERRVELYQVFQEWLNAVRATSLLRQVWVFGSFVTKKPGPDDLDFVALSAAEFDVANIALSLRHWLDHELCQELHEIDLFIIKETTSLDIRTMILETSGRSRDGQESIVEVLL